MPELIEKGTWRVDARPRLRQMPTADVLRYAKETTHYGLQLARTQAAQDVINERVVEYEATIEALQRKINKIEAVIHDTDPSSS